MLIKKHVLQDAEIEIEKVTLLSAEEYVLNETIIPRIHNWWWLRSPGNFQDTAAYIDYDGSINHNGVSDNSGCARPALKIKNPEAANLLPGDKIEAAGYIWTMLNDELALCDYYVGRLSFRDDLQAEDANMYEASDVKKWLEKWAVENGLVEGRCSGNDSD